jgi:hypothetical protein
MTWGMSYGIDHGDGVAKSPWKNLRIAEQELIQHFIISQEKKELTKALENKLLIN